MLHISFVLKEARKSEESKSGSRNNSIEKESPIICYLRYQGEELRYYPNEKINPKHWEFRKENKKYQRAKSSFKQASELNHRLDHFYTTAHNVFRKYRNEHNNEIPSREVLKSLLDAEFKGATKASKNFFAFFRELIEQSKLGIRLNPKSGKPIAKDTIKTYETTFRHLTEFQKSNRNRNINFENINLEFYNDYKEYLVKRVNLATNSIGKHVQIIKLVMNEATDLGVNKNLAYKNKRFTVIREKSDSIYLTEHEIKCLEELDLSNDSRLEKVRDLFLIGCHTGLRYSDYSTLTPENFRDGFIFTTQIKTGDEVVIPLHPMVEKIVSKYGGQLPKPISNQKTNNYLKELGRLIPSLNTPFMKNRTKGGEKISGKENGEAFLKWELLTTHTARRSFATNQYLLGIPSITIMAITGHKTEKAFLKYIRLTHMDQAKYMELLWQKRKEMLKAV